MLSIPPRIEGLTRKARGNIMGTKHDTDKINWHYFLKSHISSIEEVALIHTKGGHKYGMDNWMYVEPFEERYFSALERHLVAWLKGEERDPEWNTHHLAHVIWNCLALIHGGEKDEKVDESKANDHRFCSGYDECVLGNGRMCESCWCTAKDRHTRATGGCNSTTSTNNQ